jgi:signal transduction histidine kinase
MTGTDAQATSLRVRLTVIAAVWMVLALAVGAFLLLRNFQTTVERNFDRRLEADLDALMAGIDAGTGDRVASVGRLSDLRYANPFSGWYWQITPMIPAADGVLVPAQVDPPAPPLSDDDAVAMPDPDGLLTSRSLWDSRLSLPGGLRLQQERRGAMLGPQGKELRYVLRIRTIGEGAGPSRKLAYALIAAGDVGELRADIAGFNQTLFWSLSGLLIALVGAVVLQVRIGLRPLQRMGEALTAIREGKNDKLDGPFAEEIEPLARELNALVQHNQEVVARARTHVGNLAHFLKTPLSVLSNEAAAERTPLSETVMRQTQIMRRQVDHYLARARAAGSTMLIGSRTDAVPVIEDLARTLEKIYSDRGVEIEMLLSEGQSFRGERQDLEEMVGNLLDNACKFGRTSVSVTLAPAERGQIEIIVGDDGPGLTPDQRDKVMKRGERLDESKPGSGLGLSIVKEIAGLYGGAVALGQSPLGGLQVTLTLPGASA